MRIHLKALGCRLNEAELQTWAREFCSGGHQIAGEPEGADVVVVNTCAVTREAVRKSRQAIRRAQRANPGARLVVSGCYASLQEPGQLESLGVDLLVDNRDKDRLAEITAQRLAFPLMPNTATEPGALPLFARGRQRAFVKVQDGCRHRCTFCIVTVARGEERSRPLADIIGDINRIHEAGVQEVVLSGVHLGGYGSERGSSLYTLLRAALAETEVPRIRLGSLEPWDIPPDFFTLFENPRLLPHLHLPLQSGSDGVLRRMARRCKTRNFEALAERARAAIPDLNITTDIIVGFPGETEEEWRASIGFAERMAFGHIHIFAYSPRPGTKAARLPHHVNPVEVKQRTSQLHRLAQDAKRKTLSRYLGRRFPVLLEQGEPVGTEGRLSYCGYTPNYLKVSVGHSAPLPPGQRIRNVRLLGLSDSGDSLWGELSD